MIERSLVRLPARALSSQLGQLSLHPSGVGKSSTGLRGWGKAGCVHLCRVAGVITDPTWQVTLRSCAMESPLTVSLVGIQHLIINLTKRTGSSEYQLHLMKVSDRDRNVNKKLVLVVFLVKFIIMCHGVLPLTAIQCLHVCNGF